MIYLYQAEDGETLEHSCKMGEAPESIEQGGKIFARVFTIGGAVVQKFPYTTTQFTFPKEDAPRDHRQHSVVESAAHERRLAAKYDLGIDRG